MAQKLVKCFPLMKRKHLTNFEPTLSKSDLNFIQERVLSMLMVVGGFLLFGLIFLPQFWVKKVFGEYQTDRDDFPGTAGQFAEHVIEKLSIQNAQVRSSVSLSHFDPESRVIALSPEIYQGSSLTALTIAAHEVGHLIQAEQGSPWIRLRTALVKLSQKTEKLGAFVLIVMPFGTFLTRSPTVMLLLTGIGISGMLMRVLIHLIPLPMELDASFDKALPLLKAGEYINVEDEPGVRRILWAAAFTYLASALSSLLSVANWLRLLRR
mgnify:CR=1 FL=1